MKLYLYKSDFDLEFIVSTIPLERMGKNRGWSNRSRIIRIDRINRDGYTDEQASYKLYHCVDQQIIHNYFWDGILTSSWLDILITTGFSKETIMKHLKKGFCNGSYSPADTL